jgi:mannosyltransferase
MARQAQQGIGTYARAAPLSVAREFASAHALALIVALAAVLRFATLGVPAYWLDEWVTVTETHGSFAAVLDSVHHAEGGPPLYLILLWAWRKVLGNSEITLRSLSALLGTATVPIAFAAARELASRRAGLFAAALAATSPLLIWYSQEVRTYSLLVFLSALSFLFFIYALHRQESRWFWGWAISSGLALTTHYFALALIAPEAVWLLLRAPRVKALAACAGIGAVGLSLLPLIDQQQGKVAGVIRLLDRGDRLLAIPQHFVVGLSVPWKVVPPLVGLALIAAVAYALTRADPPSRRAFAVAGGVAMAGILLSVVPAFLGADYVITRYVLELWLPFAVAVAIALAVRSMGGLGTTAVVALCAIGVALSTWNAATPAARRVNWDDVAQALGTPRQERVVVGPGLYVGVGLSLYLPDGHLANSQERIVTSDLALLSMRPVPNYGIGPCFWGAVCGGKGLGGSGPPIKAPRQFKLVRQGSTPRVTYRIYRAPKPVRLPSPKPGQVVVVQEPG